MLRSTRMSLCEVTCTLGLATLLTWRWFSPTPTVHWPLVCCLVGTTLSAIVLIVDGLTFDEGETP